MMNDFCVASIEMDSRMRAQHGVLPSHSLFLTTEARALCARIEVEAQEQKAALLAAASEEAEQTLEQARMAGEQAVESAQVRVVEQADELFATLDDALAKVGDGIRPLVVRLAQELFDRLVLETTPEERIMAAYRRLLEEVPLKLVDAALRVHPDDLASIEAMVPAPRWAVQADAKIARGACRVDANSGEWSAGFEFAAAALRSAFADASLPGNAEEHGQTAAGELEGMVVTGEAPQSLA
ncbi:MAG: FliH/SctL family protein [Janthinobacterium lividum]